MIKKEIKNFYYGCVNTLNGREDLLFEKGDRINININKVHKGSEIDEVPAKVMKLLEWNTCLELLKTIDNGIILMDSGFKADNPDEQLIISRVKNLSSKKNISIVGFCKTSRMSTNTGRRFL